MRWRYQDPLLRLSTVFMFGVIIVVSHLVVVFSSSAATIVRKRSLSCEHTPDAEFFHTGGLIWREHHCHHLMSICEPMCVPCCISTPDQDVNIKLHQLTLIWNQFLYAVLSVKIKEGLLRHKCGCWVCLGESLCVLHESQLVVRLQ